MTAATEFCNKAENSLAKSIFAQSQDKGLIQELSYGVTRWYPRLQKLADSFLKQPIALKHLDIYLLLLIGFYQLIYMRVPDHAAVNETVNAAKALKKPWGPQLINAILRNFLRHKEKSLHQLEQDLTSQYAHPVWLIKMLKKAWPQNWEQIVIANNTPAPLVLRVNLAKITLEDYIYLLQENGMNAKSFNILLPAIIMETACDVTRLTGFAEGLVSVQDAAAQLTTLLLKLAPGQSILDACAAPGGKTAHILESQPHLHKVVAIDIDDKRVKLIHENLQRLQLQASILTGDATHPSTWWDREPFDCILLDAPCSATGVIRRHPDIKLLRQPDDILHLSQQQLQLLNSLWPLLKKNGLLLYVTCSVLPQENDDVITKFLHQHPDAQVQNISLPWGQALKHGWQILPGDNNMDGFYYCALVHQSF